jgi:hypothetical protein
MQQSEPMAPKGEMMSDSIVAIRLTRNLRYKLTYLKIFETYLESNPGPEVTALLRDLMHAQQTAIAPLSRYLRHLEVPLQDLELDQKLLSHAFSRADLRSRLRFIHDGLRRATAWYRTQLVDRQMVADPQLEVLLFQLGEIDAAKLWQTEARMSMMRIPVSTKEKEWTEQTRIAPEDEEDWRPKLVDDLGRPAWGGRQSTEWPRPSRYRRGESR